jgi:hypothetical protein
MSDSEARRVIKPSNVLLQDLDGEAVLLNIENGQYYGMDENTYDMYKTLITSTSVQEAFEVLLRNYEIEADHLRIDLEKFLSELFNNGLVTYADV